MDLNLICCSAGRCPLSYGSSAFYGNTMEYRLSSFLMKSTYEAATSSCSSEEHITS
jgi:hypothetical protein